MEDQSNVEICLSTHNPPPFPPSLPPSAFHTGRGRLVCGPAQRHHQAQPTGPGHLETIRRMRESTTAATWRGRWSGSGRKQATTKNRRRRRGRRSQRKHTPTNPSSPHRPLPRPPTHLRNPRHLLRLPLPPLPFLPPALRRLLPPCLSLPLPQSPQHFNRFYR